MCLRMNSPATSRVGNGGCPGPTRHTERKRRARKFPSIFPASRNSGWRRLMISSRGGRNQVVLSIVARLAHRSPRQRISSSKESRAAQSGNPKPQENRHAHPAFLQNRLLAQVKSSRSINCFLIFTDDLLRLRVKGAEYESFSRFHCVASLSRSWQKVGLPAAILRSDLARAQCRPSMEQEFP